MFWLGQQVRFNISQSWSHVCRCMFQYSTDMQRDVNEHRIFLCRKFSKLMRNLGTYFKILCSKSARRCLVRLAVTTLAPVMTTFLLPDIGLDTGAKCILNKTHYYIDVTGACTHARACMSANKNSKYGVVWHWPQSSCPHWAFGTCQHDVQPCN